MGKFRTPWPGLLLLLAHAFVTIDACRMLIRPSRFSTSRHMDQLASCRGVAAGVNVQDYQVATYFHVEGTGWWTEPTVAMRTVPSKCGRHFFSADLEWAMDTRATIFATALVPKGYTPPPAAAGGRIPAGLNSVALDTPAAFLADRRFRGLSVGRERVTRGCRSWCECSSRTPQDVW